MIKRFLTYMVALLALAACSDDFSSPMGGGIDENGNLHLAFNIPPMQTVSTRGADDPVDGMTSVWMYVYDGTGSLLDSREIDVTNTSGSLYTASVPLDKKITAKKTSAKFVFVANLPEFSKVGQVLEDIVKETTSSLYDSTTKYLTLSSKNLDWDDVIGTDVTIDLYHNAAKVTVNHGVLDAKGELVKGSDGLYQLDENRKYSFNTLGSAGESSMVAGGQDKCEDPTEISFRNFTHNSKEKYIHPTTNTDTYANNSYVIVEAAYGGNNYFYRLDFQTKKNLTTDKTDEEALASGNLTTTPLDIKPNHWYQFIIKSVKGPGYLTVEEAAQNPTPMIDYQIHDHAPIIYNMISDGSRELGVSKQVVNNNEKPTSEDASSVAVLNVKLFSLVEGEDEDLKLTAEQIANGDWKKFITFDDDWVTVQSISGPLSGEANVGNDNPDANNEGKVYAVTLAFKKTNNPGVLKTNLNITWHGLSRVVPVEWRRTFDTDALLSSVKLRTYNNGQENWRDINSGNKEFKSDEYFKTFLKSGVVGANREANNDKERADGFHFPVRYGDGNHWTYMYEVTINPDLMADSQGWKVSVTTDDGRTQHVSSILFSSNGQNDWKTGPISGSKNNRTFYIRCTDTDYNYYSANFNLCIMEGDKELMVYDNIKVHHTGFFHKDATNPTNVSTGTSFIKDGSANSEYTYYEVVKVGNDYWLDRNIGARSSNVYIKGGYGDKDAAGYYIVAADYNKHSDPIIYEGMCPPGYDVPSVEQWDNLRNSSNFKIELFQSYYNPRAVSDDGKTTMYFSKAQYYEGTSNDAQGENRAGYYWSKTASTGTEKDEIGNWLKCLTMSGTATSYINGRVRGKDAPYYMSLRAVSKSSGSETKRISFWVEGATHIYLYTKDGDERNAVTTWPGQSIGNWQTMVKGQQFNFSYQYSSNTTNTYYVIFNYVNDKGQIYTMSNNDFSGATTHTNIRPDDAEGWLVYGTSSASSSFPNNCGVKIESPFDNNNNSTDGTKWICSPVYADIPQYEHEFVTFRLLWPNTSGVEYFRLVDRDGKQLLNWTKWVWNTYYSKDYGTEVTVDAINGIKIQFGTSANGPATKVPNPDKVFTPSDFYDNSGNKELEITSLMDYFDAENDARVKFNEQHPVSSGSRRIFWDNSGTSGWTTVYLKYNSNGWISEEYGKAMSKIDNTNYWYMDIPSSTSAMLFNNGAWNTGNQTNDITSLSSDMTDVRENTYGKGYSNTSMK